MSAITAKASRKMKKYAVLTREPRCFLGSFDFSWEQRKVSDLAEKTYGGGTPTTSNEAYWNGDIPWIQSSDVADGKLLGVESRKRITQDGLNNSSAQLIPENSIAIITRVGVGKLAFMPYSYATSQDFLSLSKLNAEPFFTVYACYKKLQSELNAVQGTSIKGITKDELLAKSIMVPQYAEQRQIGAFFKQLDHLITLHQRECISFTGRADRLILTANKKRTTSSWEQRKFEEIAVRSSVICSDDTLPRVEYEDIVSGTGRLNKDIYAKQSIKSGIAFHQGDVLYGKLRPYLQNWLLPTFDGLAVGDFWVLQPQNADSSFLYRLIQSRQFDEVANQSTGTKMPRADWKLVSKTVFSIPSNISEQAAIGTYFTALDSLITLHQRKCANLCSPSQVVFSLLFATSTFSWEQRKFDEVFDCTVPNNTLSRAELSYDEGTVLNVHYGDVLIKYGSVLDVQKDDIPRIPHRCREDFNGALLQDGDVIIADTAEDETTGKACEIGNLQGSAIVSGLHTMVCRPRNRMALGYLGYYLNSNAYHHQLLPLMQGIKVLSLSRSNIQKTSVSYPIAVKEQQLIAYYFSQLDNLITLHQRKPFLMKWRTSDANRNQTNRLVL